jgi:hypothetical protein
MRARQQGHRHGLTVRRQQPLIAVPFDEEGEDVVGYFNDDDEADAATPASSIQQALSVIGAWEDIDSPDSLDIFDRIRHESRPSPPIESL